MCKIIWVGKWKWGVFLFLPFFKMGTTLIWVCFFWQTDLFVPNGTHWKKRDRPKMLVTCGTVFLLAWKCLCTRWGLTKQGHIKKEQTSFFLAVNIKWSRLLVKMWMINTNWSSGEIIFFRNINWSREGSFVNRKWSSVKI